MKSVMLGRTGKHNLSQDVAEPTTGDSTLDLIFSIWIQAITASFIWVPFYKAPEE